MATPHNSARKLSERFCASSKFQKRGEYCMYFPFLELQKWCKRSAEIRRRNCAVLPYISFSSSFRLRMAVYSTVPGISRTMASPMATYRALTAKAPPM